MAGKNNKIKYGIKNVYYALKNAEGGYDTPKALPGGVSVTLTPQGEMYEFYADNILYFHTEVNNGYSGEIEVAMLSDESRVDLLGETITETDKVLIETVNASSPEFALGFQIEGDVKASRYWFYNCVASRPETSSETKEETIDVKTETLNITTTAGTDGVVRAKTTVDTASSTYDDWFSTVFVPGRTE